MRLARDKEDLCCKLLRVFSTLQFMVNHVSAGNRIINGKPASIKDFPFQVFLSMYRDEGRFHCGGSLIDASWVMTAGHCFNKDDKVSSIIVISGFHDLDNRDERPHTASKLILHPQLFWNESMAINDIALVKLSKAVNFSERVAKAVLGKPGDEMKRGVVYVTGFGVTNENDDKVSEKLLVAKIRLHKKERCLKTYPNRFYPDIHICAGVRAGGSDACRGDSGGPLTKDKKMTLVDSTKVVIGIISFGRGCGRKDQYAVYTRVSAYLKWINETILSN